MKNGNNRKLGVGTCFVDHAGKRSRLSCAVFAALGVLVIAARAVEFTTLDSRAAATGAAVNRNYVLKSADGVQHTVFVQQTGSSTFSSQTATVAGNPYPALNGSNAAVTWTGLSSTSGNLSVTTTATSYTLSIKLTSTGPVVSTVVVNVPATAVTVAYASGNQGFDQFLLDAAVVDVDAAGVAVVEQPPEPEKKYGEGVLLLDNETGVDQSQAFGDEKMKLAPGYNSFPFYGEVDANGFPKAMPADMALSKMTGPDGQTYYVGRLTNGPEGSAPGWNAPAPSGVVLPGSGGTTIKLPSGMTAGVTDYVQLPQGMSRGNNVPLPGGMAVDSDPRLPDGVTPGTVGALPSGVISGGSGSLPAGVSPGTVGSGSLGGTIGTNAGGTAGTVLAGGSSTGTINEGSDGTYVPGGSLSGVKEAGLASGKAGAKEILVKGKGALDAVGGKLTGILGNANKPWTAPADGFFGGSDTSWLSFDLPIAQWTPHITVPLEWIVLIRSILVWVIKITFVVAILKLVMK